MCVRGWVCVCVWGETVSGVRLCWLAWVPFVCVCLCVCDSGDAAHALGVFWKHPCMRESLCVRLCVCVCVCACARLILCWFLPSLLHEWFKGLKKGNCEYVWMYLWRLCVFVFVCEWTSILYLSVCVCVWSERWPEAVARSDWVGGAEQRAAIRKRCSALIWLRLQNAHSTGWEPLRRSQDHKQRHTPTDSPHA